MQSNFLQLLGHSWATIAAQTETGLFLYMRQSDQVRPLSAAGWAGAPSPQPARADIDNMVQAVSREVISMFFDEPKPHCFRPAKNWVAFFRMSRSSLRMRTSRRSRSFSWARLKSSFDTTSVSRCAVIYLFSVDIPTPRSSATCLRVSPLVSAIRTAF